MANKFRHEFIICKYSDSNDIFLYQKEDGSVTTNLEEAHAFKREDAVRITEERLQDWSVMVRGCRALRYLMELYDINVTLKKSDKSPLSKFKLEILQEELIVRIMNDVEIERCDLMEIIDREYSFYGELYDEVARAIKQKA